MTRRHALPALALTLALTSCAVRGGDGAAPSPSLGSMSPVPTTTLPTPTPSAVNVLPTDLADGRHHAYLVTIDRVRLRLTVDVAQFLTGEEAEKAAREDGKEAFDYYVRNQNPRLRTLTYSAGMKVVVNTLTASETGSSSKDKAITHDKLESFFTNGKAKGRLFWFELKGGRIVRLHEQYLP